MTTPNSSITVIDQTTGVEHATQFLGGKHYPVGIPADSAGNVIDPVQSNLSAAVLSNVAYSAASGVALAANTARRGGMFFNDATVPCYLKLGATASTVSFSVKIRAGGYFELPLPCYTGGIDVIWDAAGSGALRVTELS